MSDEVDGEPGKLREFLEDYDYRVLPSITDEVLKCVETFKVTPRDLKDLLIYGFKRSFFPGDYPSKRDYVRRVLDRIEEEMLERGLDVREGRLQDRE